MGSSPFQSRRFAAPHVTIPTLWTCTLRPLRRQNGLVVTRPPSLPLSSSANCHTGRGYLIWFAFALCVPKCSPYFSPSTPAVTFFAPSSKVLAARGPHHARRNPCPLRCNCTMQPGQHMRWATAVLSRPAIGWPIFPLLILRDQLVRWSRPCWRQRNRLRWAPIGDPGTRYYPDCRPFLVELRDPVFLFLYFRIITYTTP